MSKKNQNLSYLSVFLLLALATATLHSVLSAPFIVLDDPHYVTANLQVMSGLRLENIHWAFTTFYYGNWAPLTWIYHMLDVEMFGMNAFGHHLTALVLHLLSTLLFYFLLRRFVVFEIAATRAGTEPRPYRLAGESKAVTDLRAGTEPRPYRLAEESKAVADFRAERDLQSAEPRPYSVAGESSELFPFLAALIFAIHPLHLEPITWVSSHKDILSGVFFFLTLHAYFSYARNNRISTYLLCLILFLFGLMAKSSLVTLPVVLLLFDYYPLKRKLSNKKLYFEKIPFLVLSIVFSCLTSYGQKILGATSYNFLSFSRRIGNAFYYIYSYLYNFLFPFEISIQYPHPFASLALSKIALCFLLVFLISFFAFKIRKRKPEFLVAWLLFLVLLLPYLQIVQVGNQAISDRWMYLPLVGLAIIMASLIDLIPSRLLKLLMVVFTFIFYATLSQINIFYWIQPGGVFERASEVQQNNDLAKFYLGLTREEEGDLISARKLYIEALQINSNNDLAFEKQAEILAKIAKTEDLLLYLSKIGDVDSASSAVSVKRGKILKTLASYGEASAAFFKRYGKSPMELAIVYFKKALEEYPENAFIHVALADTYLANKNKLEAKKHYLEALKYGEKTASVLNAVGAFYLQEGRSKEARAVLEKGVLENPNSLELRVNLGNAYLLGVPEMKKAKFEFLTALQLASIKNQSNVEASLGLSNVYLRDVEYDKALEVLTTALKSSRGNPKILNAIAGVYFQKKDFLPALNVINSIVESKKSFAIADKDLKISVLFNRSLLLNKLMQFHEARESLQWLLTLEPNYFPAKQLLQEVEEAILNQKPEPGQVFNFD